MYTVFMCTEHMTAALQAYIAAQYFSAVMEEFDARYTVNLAQALLYDIGTPRYQEQTSKTCPTLLQTDLPSIP